MKTQLEKRLEQLRAELASGQKALAEMQVKEANLKSTLDRIRGAIKVLEEELAKDGK